MQAFEDSLYRGPAFWAFVKYISEQLQYTNRKTKEVNSYSPSMIYDLCEREGISVDKPLVECASLYSRQRAAILNDFVKDKLMDATTAKQRFEGLRSLYSEQGFFCKLPLNKQKGQKKQIAYFTAIINILTEDTLRSISGDSSQLGFDDDPRGLSYIIDDRYGIVGASSRRFDGVYPSTYNPDIVWEIKEYYYTTTFGSRIADGVYETQLDGLEFNEVFNRTNHKVFHVLFIDGYSTWWEQGKSYLCRIIDALNSGIVDEVIVGREVFDRWPELLRSIVQS